jgi:Na+-driven multidrug efflux pump
MMALLEIVNRFCHADSDVLVAYSVATRIDSLATVPAMTFSTAIAAYVGQNIGAQKLFRIPRGVRSTLIMSTVASVVLSALIITFSHPIIRWFTADATAGVIDVGGRYLTIVGAFYAFLALMFVYNGAMRGAGDTLMPMFITLLSLWIIRIPIASQLSQRAGPDGIWWAIPIAWSIGAFCAWIYYRSGKWKNKGVVKYVEQVDTPIDIPAQV